MAQSRCYSADMQPSPTPQSLPDLAVSVVLHFSPLEQLRALLESVSRAALEAELSRVAVVCVDHSCDVDYAASCQALIEAYNARIDGASGLQISLLKPDINRGYGAGHNLAMAEVESQFHLILNPDVELAPDAIKLALDTFKTQQDIALLAPKGFSASGEPEFLAKAYPSVWVLGLRSLAPHWVKTRSGGALARYEMRDTPSETLLRPITLASGCCMWVRRAVFDEVRGFDESYFLYFEDYDLSLKLASRGTVIEHRGIRIVHHGGEASRKGFQHIRWFIGGAARFFNQWGWRWFG
jgi:GT2 family glycosyltransferase